MEGWSGWEEHKHLDQFEIHKYPDDMVSQLHGFRDAISPLALGQLKKQQNNNAPNDPITKHIHTLMS